MKTEYTNCGEEMETPEKYGVKDTAKQKKAEQFNFSEYKYQGQEKISPRQRRVPSGKAA